MAGPPSRRQRRDPPLSQAVLSAVAIREGVDETELPEPLYDAIDPDALNTLFRNTTGHVTFCYIDYIVTVESNGTVTIDE